MTDQSEAALNRAAFGRCCAPTPLALLHFGGRLELVEGVPVVEQNVAPHETSTVHSSRDASGGIQLSLAIGGDEWALQTLPSGNLRSVYEMHCAAAFGLVDPI